MGPFLNLNGATSIKDLFSPVSSLSLEPFSLFSSSDASGNTTDASGNGLFSMFSSSDASGNATDASGNGLFSMFSSSDASGNATDASGNATDASGNATDASGNATDASGNATDASGNMNPSIAPYVDFFKSLFYLFIQVCIIGYLGSSFLTLVRMSNSKKNLNMFMPSDTNAYPYCAPSDPRLRGMAAQTAEVSDDFLYSYGFPYNLYCDPGDDEGNTCSKTCNVIKQELKDPNAFMEYTPFSFWLSMSSKNTYATFRAFIKMVCTSLNSVVRQDQNDSYGIVENIVMAIGVIFIYIIGIYGGFIGFFMTYAFQFYNSGFIMFGLAWTFGLFLISWIPPLLNFFGFIFQSILLFLWVPFIQTNEATQSKVVFEIFKKKKTIWLLLFSIGMIMNAFKYLKVNEPYYVLIAVGLFLFNMYAFESI
jgi:uncharacterized protein YjbJ (UPF0337 family)